MTLEEFEKTVAEALDDIPEKFQKRLENVEICVEENPTPAQREKIRKGVLVFGLYEGVPQTQRSHYGQVLPDKITIFKDSIEKVCFSKEEIRKKVKNVVWHEIAHHFGMGEERVRKAERKNIDN